MFVLHYLYNLFILPIESFLGVLLKSFYSWNHNVALSLLILSLVVSIITSILVNWLTTSINMNSTKKDLIDKKVKEFKSVFKGKELYFVTRTLYRQHKYHPIQSVVGSLALLVQLPFFIAAYVLLKDSVILNGANFLFIKDLLKPDNLLWGINLLPLLMFIISLVGSYLIIKDKNLRLQNILLAFVFLIILYNMPSGLVLYWIFNNIFALINLVIVQKYLPSCTIKNYLPNLKKIFPIILLLVIFIIVFPMFYGKSNFSSFSYSQASQQFLYLLFSVSFILMLIISFISIFFPKRLNLILIATIFFVILTVFVDRFVNHYSLFIHLIVFCTSILFALLLQYYFQIAQKVLVVIVVIWVMTAGYQYTLYKSSTPIFNNSLNNANIKLDGKNVYYLSFDGYMAKDVWEYLYPDINNEIYSYLKANGFVFYNKSYGQGFTMSTLASVVDMDPLRWNPYSPSGNGFIYKIFKQNGYKNINYFGAGWLRTCGKYADMCIRQEGIYKNFFAVYYKDIIKSRAQEVTEDKFNTAFALLKDAQNIKGSKHIFMHIQYPNHSPEPPKNWDGKTKYAPNFAKQAVTKTLGTNVMIKASVDYIIKNDPNAIIVVTSDHGMKLDRIMVTPHPVTPQQDVYATLLAIKWPKDCKQCKDYEIYDMANLYRYIFMTLNTNHKEQLIKSTMVKIDEKKIRK